MQVNVVSSDVLIEALEHPEKHVGLIVRVWGFSAYFNNLIIIILKCPDKKLLIKRALVNEGKKVT